VAPITALAATGRIPRISANFGRPSLVVARNGVVIPLLFNRRKA
jgi:hypothetical protein